MIEYSNPQTLQGFCIILYIISNSLRHPAYFLPLPKASVHREDEEGQDQQQADQVLGGDRQL